MERLKRCEFKEKIESPEVIEAGKPFRNLSTHTYVSRALDHLFCPVCGANWKSLVWKALRSKDLKRIGEELERLSDRLSGGEFWGGYLHALRGMYNGLKQRGPTGLVRSLVDGELDEGDPKASCRGGLAGPEVLGA